MAQARQPADREQIRAAVAARYGGLALAVDVIISNCVINLSTAVPVPCLLAAAKGLPGSAC